MDSRFPHDPATTTYAIPTLLVYGILVVYSVYYLLKYLDLPVRAPQEYLWHALVSAIPDRLLLNAAQRQELVGNNMLSQRRAAKSDALRRALGLGGSAILQTLPGGQGIGMGAVGGIVRRASTSLVGSRHVLTTSDVPAGLGNWDNSCYQNSVLQALSSLESLKSWLPASESRSAESGAATNKSLQEMIAKLRDPNNNGRHIWTPAKLKNMSSWQQQDAQEYFSKIMDELDKEATVAATQKEVKAGLEVVLEEQEQKQKRSDEHGHKDQFAVRNPLEGLTAQRVTCTRCDFSEGFSMNPFNCLTVPLGSKPVYDLEECLDEYTKSEDIEGVECRSCTLLDTKARLKQLELPAELRDQVTSRIRAIEQALYSDDFSDKALKQDCQIPAKSYVGSTKSREVLVGRAPQSLVIHVNRSVFDEATGMQRKNYAKVRFPALMDLSPWTLAADGTPAPYQLRALVTHYGRHENGHYICYRKHPRAQVIADDEDMPTNGLDGDDGNWWRLSDEDVSQVTAEDVLEQGGVFMLFYERLDEPGGPHSLYDTTEAAAVPLPPDEAADWDLLSLEPASTATPSLITSAPDSVVSESDTDATDLDELPPAQAKAYVPTAPVLKTASPVYVQPTQEDMRYGMNVVSRTIMSV